LKTIHKTGIIVFATLVIGVVAFFALAPKTEQSDNNTPAESSISAKENSKAPKPAKKSEQSSTVESKPEEKKEPVCKEKKDFSLGLEESFTPKLSIKAVRWESSDKNIASADKKGKIKASNTGKAIIKAFDKDDNFAELTVTVKPAPDWVALKEYELTIGVGETYKLPAVLPEGTAAAGRKFDSSDPEIVKMNKTDWEAEFTAVKTGTSYIHVKLYNGVEAYCTVNVKPAPAKITLSSKTLTLGVGEKTELKATLSKDSVGKVTFTSSDKKAIKITQENNVCTISAEKEGTAVITTKTYNGKTAECKVIVKKAPEYVSMSKDEITLKVGQKATLGSKLNDGAASLSRTYTCSNDYVLKMTKDKWEAAFEAVNPGEAWISVQTYNGLEAYCYVIVEPKEEKKPEDQTDSQPEWEGTPTGGHVTSSDGTPWSDHSGRTVVYTDSNSIRLTNNVAVLTTGEKYNIDADNRPDNQLSYLTKDSSVAKADKYGTVTAVGIGSTDIVIRTPEGVSSRLTVLVLNTQDTTSHPDKSATDSVLNSATLSPMISNHSEIDEMVNTIISENVNDSMTNAQKVQACFDYIVRNCTYEYSGYKAITADNYISDEDQEIVEFAYSLLKEHKGTCENFAAAFTIIMRRLGFNANMAYGNISMVTGGFDGHYWTDVEIDGKHYIFDTDVEVEITGSGNEIQHSYYGMKPELNSSTYHYSYLTKVHGFSIG